MPEGSNMRDKGWKRTILRALLCLVSVWMLASPAAAQSPEPAEHVYRVSVQLVTVDAQVLRKKGWHTVSGLRAEDFELSEDGVRQKIVSFSQDTLPLSVVFLFDLTESVRPVLQSLADGALQTLHELKPEDEVAVMVYAASTKLLQDFTADRELAAAAIVKAGRMKSSDAAFFNEGLFQAAVQLEKTKNTARRRVVIWMTDNVPNVPSEEIRRKYGKNISAANLHTESAALAKVLQENVVVYTLLRTSEMSESEEARSRNASAILERLQHPPGDVYKYSERTGGLVLEATRKAVTRRLAELVDQIRSRYTLGYHPTALQPQGKFCRIEIKVVPEIKDREGKVTVIARQGYYR